MSRGLRLVFFYRFGLRRRRNVLRRRFRFGSRSRNGLAFGSDHRQNSADLYCFAFLVANLEQRTGFRAGHFSVDLIGRDLKDRFVLFDLIADGL